MGVVLFRHIPALSDSSRWCMSWRERVKDENAILAVF